jgi:tRNA(Ile2) C34 agmatinyltransferase TiaS
MPYSQSRPFGSFLAPTEHPRCPKCHNRMDLARIMAGSKGYDLRNFECDKCDYVTTITVATDPMKSNAMGWLAGSLKPPA